jgi:hypothetical protein
MHEDVGRSSDPEDVRQVLRESSGEENPSVIEVLEVYQYCIEGRNKLVEETRRVSDEYMDVVKNSHGNNEKRKEHLELSMAADKKLYDTDTEMLVKIIRNREILWD